MKIQFTQRLPLGSELHLGKERGCFRGIDLIHGPTYTGISGNFMIYKPIKHGSLNSHASLSNPSTKSVLSSQVPNPDTLQNPYTSFLQVHRLIFPWDRDLGSISLFPEKRYFFETSTTEVAIQTNLFTDLYASIGTGCSRTGWYTTFFKLPFIIIIRIGFLLASLGGSTRLLRQLQKEKLEFLFMVFLQAGALLPIRLRCYPLPVPGLCCLISYNSLRITLKCSYALVELYKSLRVLTDLTCRLKRLNGVLTCTLFRLTYELESVL